jgi:hypothetical protein
LLAIPTLHPKSTFARASSKTVGTNSRSHQEESGEESKRCTKSFILTITNFTLFLCDELLLLGPTAKFLASAINVGSARHCGPPHLPASEFIAFWCHAIKVVESEA